MCIRDRLGAALYAFEFRLPPYFARILRALAALEGVATGVDPEFRVIERVYPFVLARLVRDPDPETRQTLRRLVLTEDGESVRWRRVARVIKAVAESFEKAPSAENEDDGRRSRDREGTSARAATCWRDLAETAAAVAEGADELARNGVCAARARSASDSEPPSAAAADAVRDAMEYVMSPAGARLRAALVRDALDACDAALAEDPSEDGLGENRFTGKGAETHNNATRDDADDPSRDSETVSSTDEREGRAPAFDSAALLALVETARRTYVAAPRVWAPVIAATAAKRGSAEMSFAFGRGLAERATGENARRAAKAALKAFEKSL